MHAEAMFPYHLVFMVMLAFLVLEAQRSAFPASQQCRSSYVARLGPSMDLPDKMPVADDNDADDTPKPTPPPSNKTVCVDLDELNLAGLNHTGALEYNLLMSGVWWGMALGAVPGGWMSVCCTSENVLLGGQLLMALSTAGLPLLVAINWIPVLVAEIAVGVAAAIMIPSLYNTMANWLNDRWRTTVICLCLAARPLGQLATFTLMSLTCHWDFFFPGWIFSHFVIGFLGLVWCALWLWFAHRRAPCGGCVTVCCCCCTQPKDQKEPNCAQRVVMLKVWSAVLKQNAVWGIIIAWTCTELSWYLLELYSASLNSVNYVNEIWTSASLLSTSLLTICVGAIADKIIACNPECYRYIRKVFDTLGKVLVIILSIVVIRLHFACDKWPLVMTVVSVVKAVHALQYAGAHTNTVDIGDPCAGITASTAVLVSALARLALWNGLFYNVTLNVALLAFDPPLYALAALLACAIVIYALWGSPEISLYLPPGWDHVTDAPLCCPRARDPHRHIMQIMDQACTASSRRSSAQSVRRSRYDSETSYMDAVSSKEPFLPRPPVSAQPPDPGRVRRDVPNLVPAQGGPRDAMGGPLPDPPQYAQAVTIPGHRGDPAWPDPPRGPPDLPRGPPASLTVPPPASRRSPALARSKVPTTLEEIDETDYFIQPIREPGGVHGEPIREAAGARERRTQRLSRGRATEEAGGEWYGDGSTESQL